MRYLMAIPHIAGNRAPKPLQSLLQVAIENSSKILEIFITSSICSLSKQ